MSFSLCYCYDLSVLKKLNFKQCCTLHVLHINKKKMRRKPYVYLVSFLYSLRDFEGINNVLGIKYSITEMILYSFSVYRNIEEGFCERYLM